MAKLLLVCTFVLIAATTLVQCRSTAKSAKSESQSTSGATDETKQLLFLGGTGKETSTPDFVRLVAMRLIYGLASTMGLEDRLEGVFNGVFVPPNADEGLFGLGSYDDDGDDGGLGVLFDDI